MQINILCCTDGLTFSDCDGFKDAIAKGVITCEDGNIYIRVGSKKNGDRLMKIMTNYFKGAIERKGGKILSTKSGE